MKVISETCHAHLVQYLHFYWCELPDDSYFMYHALLIQYLHLYWCEVPDEGYFRNVSSTLNSISTFLLMWGTWWKLFQKRVMHTYFNIYICIDVRYLMIVISETCHARLIQYLHLYWCEVPDESYFRNVSCTLNSISTFVLVWGTWWKLFQKRAIHT